MDIFGESVFTVMKNRRTVIEEQGREVTDFSIGAPNIPPAPHIMKVIAEESMKPENYLYAIVDQPDMLYAVVQWYKRRYGVDIEPKNIVSVLGSQEGLSHIGLSILNEGDVVLLPEPCYPVFHDGSALAGAEIHYMPLLEENEYIIDLTAIPEEVAQRAKLMIVCYPNNPTCALAPDSFYEELIAFAKKYDIIVIHDNAYSELVFDGNTCGSFLRFPGAMEVGVEFNSLSKTYNMTGARISFVLGNREIIRKFRTLRSQIDYGIFLPVQMAAAAALNGPQDGVEAQRLTYQARRDALCGGFRSIGWNVPDGQGSMFIWAPIPEGYDSSEEFCFTLLEKTGVLCTPGSSFGTLGEGYVRFALNKPVEEIREIVKAVAEGGILR